MEDQMHFTQFDDVNLRRISGNSQQNSMNLCNDPRIRQYRSKFRRNLAEGSDFVMFSQWVVGFGPRVPLSQVALRGLRATAVLSMERKDEVTTCSSIIPSRGSTRCCLAIKLALISTFHVLSPGEKRSQVRSREP